MARYRAREIARNVRHASALVGIACEGECRGARFSALPTETRPAEGYTEVMQPGEAEHIREQERLKNGVEVDAETWKVLDDLSGAGGAR